MKIYHASPQKFTFPVYDELVKNRTNHINGTLGLWISTNSNWIKGFGTNIYEIDVLDTDCSVLSVSELFLWEKQFQKQNDFCNDNDNNGLTYYKNLRQQLLKEHKIILFQEHNSNVDMGIILDFECIKQFSLIVEQKNDNKKMHNILK